MTFKGPRSTFTHQAAKVNLVFRGNILTTKTSKCKTSMPKALGQTGSSQLGRTVTSTKEEEWGQVGGVRRDLS